jgi:hypothetical protein
MQRGDIDSAERYQPVEASAPRRTDDSKASAKVEKCRLDQAGRKSIG